MAVRKSFSPSLYNKYDTDAKTVVLAHLKAEGLTAHVNPDRYGPDILLFPDECIEVEVKMWWGFEDEFPFNTIHIPERKGKWLDRKIQFWVLNRYLDRAAIITCKQVKKAPLVEVSNVYVKEGELFYDVQTSKIQVIKLRKE